MLVRGTLHAKGHHLVDTYGSLSGIEQGIPYVRQTVRGAGDRLGVHKYAWRQVDRDAAAAFDRLSTLMRDFGGHLGHGRRATGNGKIPCQIVGV